jgi:ketosteroid isomerase-like protein
MTSNTEISERFFAASASGDMAALRALCSEGITISQNGGPAQGFEALGGLASSVKRVAPDFHYENPVRVETGNGFVEEHDAVGTLPDGTVFRIAACVVAVVADGRIVTMHEYLDSAQARPLIKALSAG